MTIKQAISEARKVAYHKRCQLNWSQEKLAEKAGVSVKVVQRLENNGDIMFSSACAIFVALGLLDANNNDDDLTEIKALLVELIDMVREK